MKVSDVFLVLSTVLAGFIATVECIGTFGASAIDQPPCECLSELVNYLEVHCPTPNPCPIRDPLTSSELADKSLRKTITNVQKPVDVLVNGNEVYVAAKSNKAIVKYDYTGVEKARYPLPNEPLFVHLHSNRLYVTTVNQNGVLRSNELGDDGEVTFTEFIQINYKPYGIKFTPNGNEFLIGTSDYKIRVYNAETLEHVRDLPSSEQKTRFIEFASNGNIYTTHTTNKVSVYSSEYELLQTLTFGSGTEKFQGLVVQCDDSKVLVSESGKIFFVGKDDTLVDTFTSTDPIFNNPRDIGVTNEGSIFITDHYANKVYLFFWERMDF